MSDFKYQTETNFPSCCIDCASEQTALKLKVTKGNYSVAGNTAISETYTIPVSICSSCIAKRVKKRTIKTIIGMTPIIVLFTTLGVLQIIQYGLMIFLLVDFLFIGLLVIFLLLFKKRPSSFLQNLDYVSTGDFVYKGVHGHLISFQNSSFLDKYIELNPRIKFERLPPENNVKGWFGAFY